jgi:hypothetical protein
MNFPDLPHLRQLQNDLWRWPKSRAAVMVGAGLSLNSEPLPGIHTKFPTWSQLVWAMFQELHPPLPGETPDQKRVRDEKFKSANALRIASEYEAAFGRRKLDLLIQSQNPDADHQPGGLHRMLMELPWADVFTTNYDTLLERAEVPGRSYQPVTKASELTTAFAPRIVKLHGSFPSQNPFIITEDDYRTFPKKFAPFVNSVQQSLIENAFVLLGFSGDDPNFLAWTGWILDHLGENHAPIYLVGPLGIGNAERALLVRRGVTPIDLSPLFLGRNLAEGIHAASLLWFLQCLSAAKPARPEKWPESKNAPITNTVGLPAVVGLSITIPEEAELFPPSKETLTAEVVSKLLRRWQYERKEYPLWVVATEGKRSALWEKTKFWIQPLAIFSQDWSAADRLLLFREINWRVETAMVPLFPESIVPFGIAVGDFFTIFKDRQSERPSQTGMPFGMASPQEVEDSWFGLAFALLREARETYNETRWVELKSQIDQVISRCPQYHDRNHYESALWAMWKIEREEAKASITKWQPTLRNPLALMWKAGLLAELDELGEARSLLRGALGEIRRALNTQGRNIELLSMEGWCTFLLFGVERAIDFSAWSSLREEFMERWHELKAWDCSPWPLKEYFDDALKAPQPVLKKEESEKHGFDPGQVTVTSHWEGDHVGPYLAAFGCMRLYEQVGIPMRIPRLNLGSAALTTACRWLAPFLGFGSPAVLIRAGKLKDLSEADFMSRTQVALMEADTANRLHHWCLQILQRELISLKGLPQMDSAQEALLEVLPEVLSRLAFRVDTLALLESFDLAIRFHQHPGIRAHIRLHKTSEPWFERLFFAAEPPVLVQWLPVLLRLSLVDESVHSLIPENHVWPDPMKHFPGVRLRGAQSSMPDSVNKVREAAAWLLLRIASETGEARRRAENRIFAIHNAKLLTPEQNQEFAKLLWSRKAANGLPDRSDIAAVSYLLLPSPVGEDVPTLIKAHILAVPLRCAVEKNEKGDTCIKRPWHVEPMINEASLASKPLIRLYEEAEGTIQWTGFESKALYEKALALWEVDKIAFDVMERGGPFGTFRDHLFSTLEQLPQFLARAVLPYMDWGTDEDWGRLLVLLADLRSEGVFPSVALPYVLIHRPSEVGTIASTLAADLCSDSENQVAAAAKAVRHWAQLFSIGRVPSLPPDLMPALVRRIVFREHRGLMQSLNVLARLLLERPEVFSRADVELIVASLLSWHRVLQLALHDESSREFDDIEKPDMRVLVGRLAGAIKIWFVSVLPGEPEPLAINLWRESCAKDPLPEVRRSFDAWTDFQEWAQLGA